jgi:hypothetical protein
LRPGRASDSAKPAVNRIRTDHYNRYSVGQRGHRSRRRRTRCKEYVDGKLRKFLRQRWQPPSVATRVAFYRFGACCERAGIAHIDTPMIEMNSRHLIRPPHRPMMDAGMVSPSALAVLRLTINWNLAARSIGRLPGSAAQNQRR